MHPKTLLSVALFAFALNGVAAGQEADPAKSRRLEAITWNPVEHKLSWTVAEGKLANNGKFESGRKLSYEIDMDAATMSTSGEDRRFSQREALSVHQLMDLVAKYAAESTLWWDAGQGVPLNAEDKAKLKQDGHKKRTPGAESDNDYRIRRDTPQPKALRIRYER